MKYALLLSTLHVAHIFLKRTHMLVNIVHVHLHVVAKKFVCQGVIKGLHLFSSNLFFMYVFHYTCIFILPVRLSSLLSHQMFLANTSCVLLSIIMVLSMEVIVSELVQLF